MQQFLDAHTHRYQPGQSCILNAVTPDDWEKLLTLAQRHPEEIRLALGVHPWYADLWTNQTGLQLKKTLRAIPANLIAGIGECGLDFLAGAPRRILPSPEQQFLCLAEQWKIAEELQLPLHLHLRKAWNPFFQFLNLQNTRREKHPVPPGSLIHGFSGSNEIARQLLSLGFSLSFSRKHLQKNRRLATLAASLPDTRCYWESDEIQEVSQQSHPEL